MNVLWTKDKLHKIFSKETLMGHVQASGDGCSAPGHCCRLCGGDNDLRHFKDTYACDGVETRYDQLLHDCFGIKVTPPDCMICEGCVKELRNIERFRALVHAAFETTPSEGSSKHSLEMYETSQKTERNAAPSIVASHKRIMESLKTKTITQQPIKKRIAQRKNDSFKSIPYKRTNVACSVCNQRYPMIVPPEGSEGFVCSRCKKDGERSGVCKKCNIVMPMGMMRDHMALHVKADLRGKSRLRCQQNKPTQLRSDNATRSNTKYQCTECKTQFNDVQTLMKHLRFVHGGGSNYICAICEKEFKSTKSLDFHMKEHSEQSVFRCRYCTATFKSKRALQTHCVVHQNFMSKSLR